LNDRATAALDLGLDDPTHALDIQFRSQQCIGLVEAKPI
jgi:hypothetical protein